MTDFRDLRVWQGAMALAESAYALTRLLPGEERFGLTLQIKRAAVSVASCIAEGNARSSLRDYLRFLSMSAGSLAELETQVLLVERLGYASGSDITVTTEAIRSVARQLQALKTALARKADTPRSPFPVPRSRP